MKKILRGAIGPALAVAVIQFVIEFVFPVFSVTQPFDRQIRMALLMMALSATTLLTGASLYALRLRRRSGASLAACTLGGAAVGLLANLASQIAKSVILCLVLAFALLNVPGADSTVWKLIFLAMSFGCLIAAVGGLVVGEIGGGLVGLLSAQGRGRP